jgi:protein gp37
MSDKTGIEWTDATWQPITGCSVVSPGCKNCYAMKLAGTRLRNHPSRAGLTIETKAGPVWNGKVRFNEQWLLQPLRWQRPRMIFVCAHGDLFHEDVPDEWIDKVFAVAALCPQHVLQILTKRSPRMRKYLSTGDRVWKIFAAVRRFIDNEYREGSRFVDDETPFDWPLPNVWAGVSCEDQTRADECIPDLLATPAAVRFVSCEPLLGPVDLRAIVFPGGQHNALTGDTDYDGGKGHPSDERLSWVICGGESGPGARPMHPDWARSLRDQCQAAGVPFFFKQWGEFVARIDRERDDPDWRMNYTHDLADNGRMKWLNLNGGCGFHGNRFHVMERVGKRAAGRLLDGAEHKAMPAKQSEGRGI